MTRRRAHRTAAFPSADVQSVPRRWDVRPGWSHPRDTEAEA